SMPCAIERDEDIPLAQYGSSHVGRMRTVYRNGLGLRYGRMMQAISGLHFNYSFPLPFWEAYAATRGAREHGAQFISACYFDLQRAISTPHPPYEALGVKVNGEYRQLNANILQIENEYYSFIRLKRVARSGERPTKALRRAGVEYVEVRALDVSAFDPVGVNQNKLRFLEAFLAHCLMKESAPIGDSEQRTLDENHLTVARRGREPGLALWRDGQTIPM